MNRLFKRSKSNKGSTLVIVLVVVAFIAILATTTIAAAMLNLKMKTVGNYAKKSFYTAEEAVDHVYAGLGKLSMETLNVAYTTQLSTLTRQDAAGTSFLVGNQQCNSEMRIAFMDSMLKSLFQTFTWDKSNASVAIPKTSEEVIGAKTVQEIMNAYIEDTTNIRVKSVGDSRLDVANSLYAGLYNYTIVIKDVAVEYKNSDGYFANVTVDVAIGLPDIKINFTDDSGGVLTTFEDYAIIGCTGVNVNASRDFKLNKAKIYAGSSGGLKIGDKAKFSTVAASVVTPGAVTVGAALNGEGTVTNSVLNMDVDTKLYCLDLVTSDVSDSCSIGISGSAFVKDDLDLDGNKNTTTVSGNYIGFSYEGSGSTSIGHLNSSAMMLNGKNCILDMRTVTSLILGGRSYIDISGTSYMTGESVSLRANQEVYLLPDAFIRSTSDSSKYYSNPVAVVNDNSDVTVNIPSTFFAYDYLSADKYKKVIIEGFVYYYFDIQKDKTDDYINAIISYNPVTDGVDVYRQALQKLLYADIMELQQSSLLNTSAGSIMYANGSLINAQLNNGMVDGVTGQVSGTDFGLGADSFVATSKDLANRFKLATEVLYEPDFFSDGTKLSGSVAVTNGSRSPITEYPSTIIINGQNVNISSMTSNVFTNFIDTTYLAQKTAMQAYVPSEQTDSSAFKVYVTNKNNGPATDKTLYIDSVSGVNHVNITKGLIITDGDVVVRQEFDGLIFAGGTVTIDNSITVQNTFEDITTMLSYVSDADREDVRKFFRAFNSEHVVEVVNPLDYNIEGITYKNIIDFNNWRKSAPVIVAEPPAPVPPVIE